MEELHIREITEKDKDWITKVVTHEWGSPLIITRKQLHHANMLPGFIAEIQDRKVGLVIYILNGKECEIVVINSLYPGQGIGTKLIESVKEVAKKNKCQKLVVITTNDNTLALRFYQKRGFHLVALYPNALAESRKIKPEIPDRGIDGIQLRDEIQLELSLTKN